MANLHIVQDKIEYRSCLKELMEFYPLVLLWQTNTGNERDVSPAKLKSYDLDRRAMLLVGKDPFPFNDFDTLYFFSDQKDIIFKSQVIICDEEKLVVSLPENLLDMSQSPPSKQKGNASSGFTESIKTLWDTHTNGFTEKIDTRLVSKSSSFTEHIQDLGYVSKFNKNAKLDPKYHFESGPSQRKNIYKDADNADFDPADLDENGRPHAKVFKNYDAAKEYGYTEDEYFAAVREAPRMKASENKDVTLSIEGIEGEQTHPLFDLSQGGMAFIIDDENQYQKGQMLNVRQIDGKPAPFKMYGEIMAIRDLEAGEGYKVGVRFITEEE